MLTEVPLTFLPFELSPYFRIPFHFLLTPSALTPLRGPSLPWVLAFRGMHPYIHSLPKYLPNSAETEVMD